MLPLAHAAVMISVNTALNAALPPLLAIKPFSSADLMTRIY